MIAKGLMIARKAEHIPDPQSVCPEKVALGGDSVAVSGDHLHDRFYAVANQNSARRYTGHAHHRGLVISDVCRVHTAPDKVYFSLKIFQIRAFGGAAFAGYSKMTGLEHSFKVTSRHH